MNALIGKRYASALYGIADESKQIDKVFADVKCIQECFSSKKFKSFVENPVLPQGTQEKIILELFQEKTQELTIHFLRFLIYKQRLNFLEDIIIEFQDAYYREKGVLQATIQAAEKLSSAQGEEAVNRLQKYFKKDVQIQTSVDPRMLGGFKIQIEDKVFDYTLDEQLKRFKRTVLKG